MRVLIILLALTVPALAQQKVSPHQQMQPSALDQALGQKLMEEMNSCIQIRSQLITAQERIKELEAKAPKEPDKK